MKEINIVLAGVGGQGTLLAAEILGTAAVKTELNVRVSEIHGMAQRGGAVSSDVRIGETVWSPTVMEGQADVLLGFEPLETLRNLRFASEKTLVIVSTETIPPAELAARNETYPSLNGIVKKICLVSGSVLIVPTRKLAEEAGSSLMQNTILLGALAASEKLPVERKAFIDAIKELVPAKFLEGNINAFKLGYEYVKTGQAEASALLKR